MKRLFLAVVVLGLAACAKKEAAPQPATQTPAAAPAPATAPTDTMAPAQSADTTHKGATDMAPAKKKSM